MPLGQPRARALGRRGRVLLWVAVLGLLAPVGAVSTGAASARVASAAPPSAADVSAQRTEVERLRGDLEDRAAAVEAAEARLAELAAAAGSALEQYTVAVQAQADAEARHWEESERLDAAQIALSSTRGDLGRWAARTYRDGRGGAEYAGLMTLLDASSPDDFTQRLSMLRVVGRTQVGTLQQAGDAARAQADAAQRAARTSQEVAETTRAAEAAKEASNRLVAEQRAELDALNALLAESRDAVADAEAKAARLAQARAIAEQLSWQARLPGGNVALTADGSTGNVVTGVTGECRGGEVDRYPNGQIPPSALCPLWGAPGHLLRADAAYAFDRLAEAFATAHAKPICVTDSYRTLESQVRLRAAKPSLAAVPGTSNHGWGTALDLCGGIQQFGTPEHRWMQVNAPLFGWFNPGWAQQGGSKPEPWHWEFAG